VEENGDNNNDKFKGDTLSEKNVKDTEESWEEEIQLNKMNENKKKEFVEYINYEEEETEQNHLTKNKQKEVEEYESDEEEVFQLNKIPGESGKNVEEKKNEEEEKNKGVEVTHEMKGPEVTNEIPILVKNERKEIIKAPNNGHEDTVKHVIIDGVEMSGFKEQEILA
jgi:hypothetical protein